MTARSMIEYLKLYEPYDPVQFIVADPSMGVRKVYQVEDVFAITDVEYPTLMIEIGEPESMDEEKNYEESTPGI